VTAPSAAAAVDHPDQQVDGDGDDGKHQEEFQHLARVALRPAGNVGRRLVPMKEFAIYTALRLVVFAAVLVMVLGAWVRLFGRDESPLWPLVIAFALSGLISYLVLNRPRAALARRVQERADRTAAKFDEMRSSED
jgi:hypothetical protein